MDDPPQVVAQPDPMTDREHLQQYLSGRDVRCPKCGYNLRNCEMDRCPECGTELELTVDQRNPPLAAWLLMFTAAMLCAGEAIYAFGWLFMDVVVWQDLSTRNWATTAIEMLMLLNVPLAIVIAFARPMIMRLDLTVQFLLAALLWLISGALFVAYWVTWTLFV